MNADLSQADEAYRLAILVEALAGEARQASLHSIAELLTEAAAEAHRAREAHDNRRRAA